MGTDGYGVKGAGAEDFRREAEDREMRDKDSKEV